MNFQISADSRVMNMHYRVHMEDGSKYDVPLLIIALNRAQYYAKQDNITLQESLDNDTLPMFENDEEIEDWARNNMDWDDVSSLAKCVKTPDDVDFQESWMNGEFEIV